MMTKVFLAGCMLLSSLWLRAGWAPDSVQVALKQLCPAATEVSWTRSYEYYVAHFVQNGFGMKAWFEADGSWAMKQTDWETMDQAPTAVFNAYTMSDYAMGDVQDVVLVQFPRWQAIVAVIVGMPNEQVRYLLLYTPDGRLLNARNVTGLYDVLGAPTFL